MVVALVTGGAGFVYNNNQNEKEASSLAAEKVAMEQKVADDKMATDKEASMEKTDEVMSKPDEVMTKTETPAAETVMVKAPSYTTLADYDKDPSVYKDNKKVYFFHAAWCPICRSIDEDITSDPSQIPTGTTFIKTDFDTATSLRQKYGVTTQYSFVQVDGSGNEVKQWNATTLDKAIAGIQ